MNIGRKSGLSKTDLPNHSTGTKENRGGGVKDGKTI